MMIFSLVAMTGLEKCCITSAYLQWLCHSGEWPVDLLFAKKKHCSRLERASGNNCFTCFSMGDLGMQVSVRLFVYS